MQQRQFTKEQKQKIRDYMRAGYTQVFVDPENPDGDLIPGYADWILEITLDMLDAGWNPKIHKLGKI